MMILVLILFLFLLATITDRQKYNMAGIAGVEKAPHVEEKIDNQNSCTVCFGWILDQQP